MRKRIQDRAAELGVTQSTGTNLSAIKETQEGAAKQGRSSELDMSAFNKKEEDYSTPKYMQAFTSGKVRSCMERETREGGARGAKGHSVANI